MKDLRYISPDILLYAVLSNNSTSSSDICPKWLEFVFDLCSQGQGYQLRNNKYKGTENAFVIQNYVNNPALSFSYYISFYKTGSINQDVHCYIAIVDNYDELNDSKQLTFNLDVENYQIISQQVVQFLLEHQKKINHYIYE